MTGSPRADGAIRIAALDLDGTLIDADGQPYEGVVTGLRALRRRGVVPLIISGRTARSFRGLAHLDDLFAEVDDEVLLSEGNVRLARGADLLSYPRTCSPAVLRRLVDDDPGIDLVAEWSGSLHATTARAAAQFAMGYRLPRRHIPVTGPATAEGPWFTAVTVFRSRTPVPDLVAGLDCEITAVGPFGADVVRPRGTGKAAALVRHLRRRFGEPDLGRTLAIGDGAADAAMLSACAVSAAPRHADAAAADAADVHLQDDLASFLHDFRPERW
ncbi:HAD family hydrolase [Streptomyces anulatus]|uniref:HAD family hydrolase n=1 Tax=Streptomyces anulatus TaxID=1892 RepID=UPI003657182F